MVRAIWGKGQPIVKYRDAAVSPAKTAEPIDMPFELWIRVGPRNHAGLLTGGPDNLWERRILGGKARSIVKYRDVP